MLVPPSGGLLVTQQRFVARPRRLRVPVQQVQLGECVLHHSRIFSLRKRPVELLTGFAEVATLPEGESQPITRQRTFGLHRHDPRFVYMRTGRRFDYQIPLQRLERRIELGGTTRRGNRGLMMPHIAQHKAAQQVRIGVFGELRQQVVEHLHGLLVLSTLVEDFREMQPRIAKGSRIHRAFKPPLRSTQVSGPLFNQPAFEQGIGIVWVFGNERIELAYGIGGMANQPRELG